MSDDMLLYIFKQACQLQGVSVKMSDEHIISVMRAMQFGGGIPLSMIVTGSGEHFRILMCTRKEVQHG